MQRRLFWAAFAATIVLVSGWLLVDAGHGILLYTTQGDLCSKIDVRVRRGDQVANIAYCAERHSHVYRAFALECMVAVSGVVALAFLVRARKVKTKRIEPTND
jgi:hypothetical protein